MCGIAGALGRPGASTGELEDAVSRALRRMAHRGPDGEALRCDVQGGAVLGHRLLAITSSAGRGRQPMASEDGGRLLVANAEIYNHRELKAELESLGHRFATGSDNETILHGYEEWGMGLERRLRGEWAFAIWDGERRACVLSRDAFGVKPLYYCPSPGPGGARFAFASEARALLAGGFARAEIDPHGIRSYLEWQSVAAPLTLTRGVLAVEPGCRLVVLPDGTWRQERHTAIDAEPAAHGARVDAEAIRRRPPARPRPTRRRATSRTTTSRRAGPPSRATTPSPISRREAARRSRASGSTRTRIAA